MSEHTVWPASKAKPALLANGTVCPGCNLIEFGELCMVKCSHGPDCIHHRHHKRIHPMRKFFEVITFRRNHNDH